MIKDKPNPNNLHLYLGRVFYTKDGERRELVRPYEEENGWYVKYREGTDPIPIGCITLSYLIRTGYYILRNKK